jgi:hypothetical protein
LGSRHQLRVPPNWGDKLLVSAGSVLKKLEHATDDSRISFIPLPGGYERSRVSAAVD